MDFRNELAATCPIPFLWDHKGENGKPVSEMGYIRADNDGYRWWNTAFPVNKALETDALIDELDAVYDAFTAAFPTLTSLKRYCEDHLDPLGSDDTEYNAYLDLGGPGFYWLRLITREKDYNLYLHCYSKIMITEVSNGKKDA